MQIDFFVFELLELHLVTHGNGLWPVTYYIYFTPVKSIDLCHGEKDEDDHIFGPVL